MYSYKSPVLHRTSRLEDVTAAGDWQQLFCFCFIFSMHRRAWHVVWSLRSDNGPPCVQLGTIRAWYIACKPLIVTACENANKLREFILALFTARPKSNHDHISMQKMRNASPQVDLLPNLSRSTAAGHCFCPVTAMNL